MDHTDILNRILSLSCSNPAHDGYQEYSIVLHCIDLKIIAKPNGVHHDNNGDYLWTTFEILELVEA